MSDIINIDELKQILQQFADERDWNQFHHPKNLAMALSVEASELVEIFQWLKESESLQAVNDSTIKTKTAHELADILLYLIRLADCMQINLSQAIKTKLALNHAKYPAEKVKGQAKQP